MPDHPFAYGGRVREHRLIVEKGLGRFLRPTEIVHHINYIEDDNRPENLMLFKNVRAHHKIHKRSRYLLKEFIRAKGLQSELTTFIQSHLENQEEGLGNIVF